jgi:hypothetical protein
MQAHLFVEKSRDAPLITEGNMICEVAFGNLDASPN